MMKVLSDTEFEFVLADIRSKLDAQANKSVDASGLWQYRGIDGLKCPVGHIIKDEFYDPNFEGYDCTRSELIEAIQKSLDTQLTKSQIETLRKYQTVHDLFWKPNTYQTYSEALVEYDDYVW